VKALQEKLNAQGAGLVADGVFGVGTHSAVIAFQAKNGLTADGIVGPGTRAALAL
jgi:peptidoglycan hydrolase-like protein with peptidoglycan-binding domain